MGLASTTHVHASYYLGSKRAKDLNGNERPGRTRVVHFPGVTTRTRDEYYTNRTYAHLWGTNDQIYAKYFIAD